MHRILISFPSPDSPTFAITEPQSVHHLVGVLRVKPGETVECLNGQGGWLQGIIESATRSAVQLGSVKRRIEPRLPLQITLAAALIKPELFEWLLQKAAELGVFRIIPLVTQRTTLRTAQAVSENKLSRWRRILESASIQCGRAWLPVLEDPLDFDKAVGMDAALKLIFVADDRAALPLRQVLEKVPARGEVVVFIGPEGDFSPEENALAKQRHCTGAWLGETILRAETAALAVLSVLQMKEGGQFAVESAAS